MEDCFVIPLKDWHEIWKDLLMKLLIAPSTMNLKMILILRQLIGYLDDDVDTLIFNICHSYDGDMYLYSVPARKTVRIMEYSILQLIKICMSLSITLKIHMIWTFDSPMTWWCNIELRYIEWLDGSDTWILQVYRSREISKEKISIRIVEYNWYSSVVDDVLEFEDDPFSKWGRMTKRRYNLEAAVQPPTPIYLGPTFLLLSWPTAICMKVNENVSAFS